MAKLRQSFGLKVQFNKKISSKIINILTFDPPDYETSGLIYAFCINPVA
jgi:hypothetical protein